jgi:hypothetical protein
LLNNIPWEILTNWGARKQTGDHLKVVWQL